MCRVLMFFFGIAFITSSSAAVDEYQLEQLIGWTIVATKQVEGHKPEGKPKSDDFEGCDFGMIIYFTDGSSLECNSFGYQYAFMPKTIIFGKAMDYKGKRVTIYKMLVQGQVYDVY